MGRTRVAHSIWAMMVGCGEVASASAGRSRGVQVGVRGDAGAGTSLPFLPLPDAQSALGRSLLQMSHLEGGIEAGGDQADFWHPVHLGHPLGVLAVKVAVVLGGLGGL